MRISPTIRLLLLPPGGFHGRHDLPFPPCRTGAPIRRWCGAAGSPAASPFAHDQAPSPLIHAMPDLVHSPLRVARARQLAQASRRARAARRRGLRRGRMGRGAAAGARGIAARARRARPDRDLRRLHGWSSAGRLPCPHADAPIPLRRRRLRGPGRQLQLGRGPVPAAAHHRHLRAGDGPRHRLEQRGGQYAAADRLWRHRAAQYADHVRRRRRPSARLAGAGARPACGR